MKFLEFKQRLDELRLRYKSPNQDTHYNVISHRGNVWLVSDSDPNIEQVVQDLHNYTGVLQPDDDFMDIYDASEERLDVLWGMYYPDRNALYTSVRSELGHHPRASLELRKLADFLGVDYVQGERTAWRGDPEEVSYHRSEMEGKVPDVLYHGTDASALLDILRLGLIPKRGESNWPGVGQFPFVFLAADYHKALFHAVRQQQEGRGAPVILKVKIPDRDKIEPDFDAMSTLGPGDDDEKAARLGYTGSRAYWHDSHMTQRQNISDYNPGAENLPLISGVVGYSGRIPPSHILEVHADLRGEDFDSEDPQFVEYSMPEERDKLLRAIDIAEEYGSYYPGMEDELDQEDDDLNEDDWDDHNQALQDTGFWGRAGAGVLFQARDTGRILFAHRSRHVEQPGTWGTWGGAIDSGENPAQAAARESMEEAGYRPNPNDIIPLYVFEHESGFRYYNFLVITPTEFEPMLDWETQGYEWVEYGNWPSPLHFGAADLLRDSKSTAVMQKLSQ